MGLMENQGPIPFRYCPTWNNNEDFKNLIVEVWSQKFMRSPYYVWETKLKNLRKELKKWAIENEK